MESSQLLIIEEYVILLLAIATIVGIIVQRLRMPYTVGLVLMGLGMALFTNFEIQLTPELILGLLVPPLIFEAAFHIRIEALKRDLVTILTLAIPGVILTTVLVGGVIAWGAGIRLEIALLFGALIAATDPVAVVALFRSLGVPKRLQVLLEGESLLNDGTAIVVFSLVLAAITGEKFNIFQGLSDFFRIAGGGFIIGMILGAIAAETTRRIDNHLIETTLTTVLAYGAYLTAESIHVSGVLAVVAAGLISGNIGPKGMSPTTRIVVFNFWEYAAFLANSFVFLLIGLQLDLTLLLENWSVILWAIAAVLGARLVSIYVLSAVGKKIPIRWKHILYWGGLRGAISLALVLGLPLNLGPERPQLQAMAFGVVLFTLLVQGITMGPLVRRMHLVKRSQIQEEYERRHARAMAAQASFNQVQQMSRDGLISERTWQSLEKVLKNHLDNLVDAVRATLKADPTVEAEELNTARREALHAQRSTLNNLLTDGVISEETYHMLGNEVDTALADPNANWLSLVRENSPTMPAIRQMIVAIIQKQDLENVRNALEKVDCRITQLPSQGMFLKRNNLTLIIGMPENLLETAVQLMEKSCRRRFKFSPSPIPGLPLFSPKRIQVGGATVFVFDVLRYEEF